MAAALSLAARAAEQVMDEYVGEASWTFVSGTIKRVLIDVIGESLTDLSAEVPAAFARQ